MKGNSNKKEFNIKKQTIEWVSEREKRIMIMKKPVFSEYLLKFFSILKHSPLL